MATMTKPTGHADMYDSGTNTPAGVDHGHGPCPDPGTVYTLGEPPAHATTELGEESRECLKRLAAFVPAEPMQ
jgi:hypothetical protein